jgi:rhodanese-related sulfurtransferase
MTALDTQTTPSPTASMKSPSLEVDLQTAKRMLGEPGTILIDVREADEHARERIAGSRLIPLSKVTSNEIAGLGAKRILFHCRGGRRSLDAATRCAGLVQHGVEIFSVAGGIEAWRAAGLGTELNASRPKLSVMQQTQLTIGAAVVAGTALGFFVNPWFLALPAFMGCGMIFAGATGTCGLATLLGLAPWNRATQGHAGSCTTGSCTTGSCATK